MSDYPEFSIGAALDAYDELRRQEREEERDQRPAPDPLDDYAALLRSGSHPPNECGDPYSCCGKDYYESLQQQADDEDTLP